MNIEPPSRRIASSFKLGIASLLAAVAALPVACSSGFDRFPEGSKPVAGSGQGASASAGTSSAGSGATATGGSAGGGFAGDGLGGSAGLGGSDDIGAGGDNAAGASGISTNCPASARRCAGETPQECRAGSWQDLGACAVDTPKCLKGACAACLPGDVRCLSDLIPQQCTDKGVWASGTACDNLCKDGACLGACQPDEYQCFGTVQQKCDAEGGWYNFKQCPKNCHDGLCVGDCKPGEKRCTDKTPEQCNADGVWEATDACADLCFKGECAKPCDASNGECATTETLADGFDQPVALAVDASGVYWISQGDGSIARLGLEPGASVEPVALAQPNVATLALDETYVYWTVLQPGDTCGGATAKIVRKPKADLAAAPELITSTSQYCADTPVSLLVSGNHVYVVNAGYFSTEVGHAPNVANTKLTSVYTSSIEPREHEAQVSGGYLFLQEFGIRRSVLGSATSEAILSTTDYSRGLAVYANNVYVATQVTPGYLLKWVPTVGSALPKSMPFPLTSSDDLIWLYIENDTIYWLQYTYTGASIRKMPLAGGAVTVVANVKQSISQSCDAFAVCPAGVYPQVYGGYVYWTEPETGSIKRAPK